MAVDVVNEYVKGVEEKNRRQRLRKKGRDEERKRQQQPREELLLKQALTLLVPPGPPEITLSTSVTSVTDVYREWFSRSAVGDGKPLQYYFLLAPPGGKGPSSHYIQNRHIDNGYGRT